MFLNCSRRVTDTTPALPWSVVPSGAGARPPVSRSPAPPRSTSHVMRPSDPRFPWLASPSSAMHAPSQLVLYLRSLIKDIGGKDLALACSFRPRGRAARAATPCPSRQHPSASPVPTPGRSSHPFQDIPFLSPTYFCPFALSRVSDSAPAWRVPRPAFGAALVSLKCLFCPMLRGVLTGEGGSGGAPFPAHGDAVGTAPWPPLGVGCRGPPSAGSCSWG